VRAFAPWAMRVAAVITLVLATLVPAFAEDTAVLTRPKDGATGVSESDAALRLDARFGCDLPAPDRHVSRRQRPLRIVHPPRNPSQPQGSIAVRDPERDHDRVVREDDECPGYCGAQDTFYVGTLKGVGRIYQQTLIDTYSKVGFAKLYDRKTPITAADLLNDRVLPFFEENGIPLCRVLTDRGTDYCGTDRHEYELYLAIENIDHTRTKARSPQTNGVCQRFNRTVLNEFYRVAFRRKLYATLEELQADLDEWMRGYNEDRPHQGRWCFGKTPNQTFLDSLPIAKEKMLAADAA